MRVAFAYLLASTHAFIPQPRPSLCGRRRLLQFVSATSEISQEIGKLKKVLEKEYVSFFAPFEKEYYSQSVVFNDPLSSLSGTESYQNNVDMLSGRTLMGSLLFEDAGIVLHSVSGGQLDEDGSIGDITTRWTLRFTFKALPWQPTARFTGISIYQVKTGGPKGVQITKQSDFWDSINLQQGGSYTPVDKSLALKDFLSQIKPGFAAPAAGPELPYQLLRRGNGYEVRRYPSFATVEISYERRDDAFGVLGSFTAGMNPLSPALMQVDEAGKTMAWPLAFTPPGAPSPEIPDAAIEKAKASSAFKIVTVPESVIAIGRFADASIEPVVRKADLALRQALSRDNLETESDDLRFAQYDAVYSMGQRRGEVWIPLAKHPW